MASTVKQMVTEYTSVFAAASTASSALRDISVAIVDFADLCCQVTDELRGIARILMFSSIVSFSVSQVRRDIPAGGSSLGHAQDRGYAPDQELGS